MQTLQDITNSIFTMLPHSYSKGFSFLPLKTKNPTVYQDRLGYMEARLFQCDPQPLPLQPPLLTCHHTKLTSRRLGPPFGSPAPECHVLSSYHECRFCHPWSEGGLACKIQSTSKQFVVIHLSEARWSNRVSRSRGKRRWCNS